jgi:hypothetical protein
MAQVSRGETWVVVRTAGRACVYRKLTPGTHIDSAQMMFRAGAALTTFKTLKTDRGTGLVTASLIEA